MNEKYVYWKPKAEKKTVVLAGIEGLEKSYRIFNGTSVSENFPETAFLKFNADFKKKYFTCRLSFKSFGSDGLFIEANRIYPKKKIYLI
jgi:hypothetical protein